MELPIIAKYDEKVPSLQDQNWIDWIRILEIDGIHVVSIWIIDQATKALRQYQEIAFDSMWDAEGYLRDELGVDLPDEQEEKEWIDYDVD